MYRILVHLANCYRACATPNFNRCIVGINIFASSGQITLMGMGGGGLNHGSETV